MKNCKDCDCAYCDRQGQDYVPQNCEYHKPTNAEAIRSLTDEQFADWLSIYCCRNKTYDAHCTTFGNCKDCWLAWLHEEAKE